MERIAGIERLLAARAFNSERIQLKVEAHEQNYSFYFRSNENEAWTILLENTDGRLLSTDLAGGFTGAYMGMYASSQGSSSDNHADFDWFSYEELES